MAATRAIFDERGLQHAGVEEVARAVGIARGLVYRVVASKEELHVLVVVDYLDELEPLLAAAGDRRPPPAVHAERMLEAFAGFCLRHPAFLDGSMSLMQRPATALRAVVSESVWLRLGTAMGACLGHVTAMLRAGVAAGAFGVDDPDLTANVLWTQVLGTMHLARIGVGVRPGPELFTVRPADVVAASVASALATIGAGSAAGSAPTHQGRAGSGGPPSRGGRRAAS